MRAVAKLGTIGLALSSPAMAELATMARITDGDTFRTATGERIRIAAIDTPKTMRNRARCALEIVRGRAARAQLRDLIEWRRVALTRTGRSYNRTVALVSVDGRDIGTEMAQRGAARPWPRYRPKPDWCR